MQFLVDRDCIGKGPAIGEGLAFWGSRYNATMKNFNINFFVFSFSVLLLFGGCDTSTDGVSGQLAEVDLSETVDPMVTSGDPASEHTPADVTPDDSSKPPEVAISAGAFRMAAEAGRYEKVEAALKSGVDVNDADHGTRFTALHLACYEGHLDVVKLLMKHNVDITQLAQNDLSPLHLAAFNGHTKVVELLLENDAKIDAQDREGKTPLLHACTGSFAKTVELLIEKGANINIREATEGYTPLMMAAGIGEVEVVKVLLRNDADTTVIDEDGDSALSHAKKKGHAEIVQLLE